MRIGSPIVLAMLLLLATGCSFSITQPVNVAEVVVSPTVQLTEDVTVATEEIPTATPAPSPTFTSVVPKSEPTATSTIATATEEAPVTEEKKKPALFFFYADWCSACSQMRPVIEKLKPEYSDRIRFIMVNVDDPESRELVVMVGVRAIPLTIFLTSPDQEAQRWVGPRPEAVLRAAFDEAFKSDL